MLNVRPAKRSEVTGSSLCGYLDVTYDDLVDYLGEPTIVENGENKVYHEWMLVIEGELVTIYDYKQNGRTTPNYSWHVGGKSKNSLSALNELLEICDSKNLAYRG